jgi:hypothetical protein
MAVTTLSVLTVCGREKLGMGNKSSSVQKVTAGCAAAQSAAELAVNNVRTIVFSGSDMWWDLASSAYYVVPKVAEKSKWINSNFAGNIWFGGLDAGGQLKIAAQTYRQDGIDFWTGPLSTIDASVTEDVCVKYDKIFKITRSEVDEFVKNGGELTQRIKEWPGNGDISLNQDPLLAPYFDKDGSGDYNPEAGDYPYYDVYNNAGKDNNGVCKARVFGDETLWWVYNDKGNIHTATTGQPIGMEIRAQAFAFKTTDEINNMTFYSYQIINRSSFELTNTYMTVWTDADMGYYADDFIGCDVKRGLGYVYNADNFDETVGGVLGYGSYIPALGCDFFQGPVNTTDGIDNDRDNGLTIPGEQTGIDEPGEQMGMTKFLYFNNAYGNPPQYTRDPDNATQYYQYMTGFWKDGTPFTCGGNGYGGAIQTSFAYPDNTYLTPLSGLGYSCGFPWTEVSAGNIGADRRFLQSSGPFNLLPGQVNYITVGLPWARTTTTDQNASVALLKIADDKAQALFDNCFKVLGGPEAPDMTIQEMDNELILYFSNKPASNNYLNNYKELDVSILVDTISPVFSVPSPSNTAFRFVDRYYHFEGFKVYQLKNEKITQEELIDASKAKIVFSCDVNNGVKRLINYEYDATSGGDVAKVKAEGTDNGISSTFHFTRDVFSSSIDQKVVNNKTYYFLTVAYAYNEYAKYKEDQPILSQNAPSSLGQKRPYLEGRLSKRAYGIPHNPEPEKFGTSSNSFYGYGPKITRVEGQGNGGNIMNLTQGSIDAIVNSGGRVDQITYENGAGPVKVKVVDPLNVPNSEFAIEFISRNWFNNKDSVNSDPCRSSSYHKQFPYQKLSSRNTPWGNYLADSTTWRLKDLTTGKEYVPCKSIKLGEEFYFSELGLSVNIGQPNDIAPVLANVDKIVKPSDFLQGTITFSDPTKIWLSGVTDRDSPDGFNWIRSGKYNAPKSLNDASQNDYIATGATLNLDPEQVFENVLGGTWAPYCLTAASKTTTPGATFAAPAYSGLFTGVVGANETEAKLNAPYDIRTLASVDIVFTSDKSKWTHCLVLEECDDQIANPTGAKKLESKRKRSVDKQGVPSNVVGCNLSEALLDTFNYGLGWFPGYAINIETGERLNIAFGEDSYQTGNNGNDMMWNPTTVTSETGYRYAFGGRHYIYVFGHNRSNTKYLGTTTIAGRNLDNKLLGVGTYNDFTDMVHSYKYGFNNSNTKVLDNIWSEALWVNIPLLSDTRFSFSNPANIPCDAKVRLRVSKPYKTALSGTIKVTAAPALGASIIPASILNNNTLANLSADTLTTSIVNNNKGYYRFTTADIFSEVNKADKEKSALDLINVVPNPYYAYSTYEQGRVDNVIRITNLPNKCKIKIFTLNGTLVRTFDRDVAGQEDINIVSQGSEFVHSKRLPFQDWDLKNQSGISVASGLYIIHVDVPGVGEKILKWFGVMRPLDLQNY